MQILELVVQHWKEAEFVGISASALADTLSTNHEDVVRDLERLARNGEVHLRKTQLGQMRLPSELSLVGDTYVPPTFDMFDTVIAFPARRVLEDRFRRDGVDYGIFTNRLHQGDTQLAHYFFRRDVLDKYFRQPDRYRVTDDSTGGRVAMTTEYYESFPDETKDDNTFVDVEFGNIRLKDGTHAIGVVAIDLARLPKQEQLHWAAHELGKPEFAEQNDDWNEHVAEIFEASWDAKHVDLFQELTDVLESVNTVVGGRLFRKTTNPQLRIPPLNTVAEYQAAHKELFKLVSSDNLDGDLLKRALVKAGHVTADFRHESGREKGKWQLLKMLCERHEVDFDVLALVNNSRQADAHQITEHSGLPTEYFPERFKHELSRLVSELRKLTGATS
jgi:hypothetical protein